MWAMRVLLMLVVFLSAGSLLAAGRPDESTLLPRPSSVQPGTGYLAIDRSFSVELSGSRDAMLERGVQRFLDHLSKETGILLRYKPGETSQAKLLIHAEHAAGEVLKLGEDESYELTISDSGAKLTAPNALGVLHGLQTFLQLVRTSANGFVVPAVTIKDQPRFAWRGLLVDPGRHFLPVEVLKRNIDGMEAVKLNVLHLHLTDNEGFRIESKRFSKLHELGSDGLYYTQAELRELIAYARDRGIRVLPEMEMPGHSGSWFVGYPELASGLGPYRLDDDKDPLLDVTREATYKFLDKLIEEMAKLFPDAYFHIGGDEVDGKQWDSNPKIQAFIHAHGMKNNQDLQAYFNQRLQKILSKHHKTMMGWDEVLHPELPKAIVVQSWRGQQSLASAAKQGYSGLLSFGYYLDLMWTVERHYAVDPMSGDAANLSDEEKKRILGGETCMWGEWTTPENIDSRIWPRAAAIAERLWSSADVQDVSSMYSRLEELSWRLEWLGLTHRSAKIQMMRRMAGTEDMSALRTLAEVVEPVKDYTRMNSLKGPWDFRAPLNRLVDAVDPESLMARRFAEQVQQYLQSGRKDKALAAEIRRRLAAWKENDARLHPLFERSFLLKEVQPISEDLSALGGAGFAALDYLERGERGPDVWKTQELAVLERAGTAKADLLLMVVAPVRELVEASAGKAAQ